MYCFPCLWIHFNLLSPHPQWTLRLILIHGVHKCHNLGNIFWWCSRKRIWLIRVELEGRGGCRHNASFRNHKMFLSSGIHKLNQVSFNYTVQISLYGFFCATLHTQLFLGAQQAPLYLILSVRPSVANSQVFPSYLIQYAGGKVLRNTFAEHNAQTRNRQDLHKTQPTRRQHIDNTQTTHG